MIKINKTPNNPLINAYMNGDIESFSKLIEEGENVNCLNEDNRSLISIVVKNSKKLKNNKDFFDKLISSGVALNRIGTGMDLLSTAVFNQNDIYYAKIMLKNNIEIDSFGRFYTKNFMGYDEIGTYGPPIFEALEEGKLEYFNLFLKNNANVNCLDCTGNSILHHLVNNCCYNFTKKEMVRIFNILLEAGADHESRNSNGRQILHSIVKEHDNYLLTNLFKKVKDIDIDAKDNRGNTALMLSSDFDNIEAMKFLIKKGANLDICNLDGFDVLSSCFYMHKIEAFKLMIDSGADVFSKYKNSTGDSILHTIVFTDIASLQDNGHDFKLKKYYTAVLSKHPELLRKKNNSMLSPIEILKKRGYLTKEKEKFLNKFESKIKSPKNKSMGVDSSNHK